MNLKRLLLTAVTVLYMISLPGNNGEDTLKTDKKQEK